MQTIKGIIGLDIDGTITAQVNQLDKAVERFFHELHDTGWMIIFLTGRSLTFSESVLKTLHFPFLFAGQNGASLFEMPEKKLFKKYHLSKALIAKLQKIFANHQTDLILYSENSSGDFCYSRPSHFPSSHQSHLKYLESLTSVPSVEFTKLEQIEQAQFPMAKGVGFYEEMKPIFEEIRTLPEISSCLIQDPFRQRGYYILITHSQANKGAIFQELTQLIEEKQQKPLITIAAGDDMNDYPMLKAAQIPIAMQTAPQELLDIGKIIAKPASENGIISALEQAIELSS